MRGCWGGESAAEAALSRVFGVGVRPLRLQEAVFDACLAGWRRQQAGRHLRAGTVRARELVVRRFRERTGCWPWQWRAIDVDEWMEDLGGPPRRLAVSTLRSYQGALHTADGTVKRAPHTPTKSRPKRSQNKPGEGAQLVWDDLEELD